MNSIKVIFPYKYKGMWVFDDEKFGLDKEPFIAGADQIIEYMTASIPDAEDGFILIFSANLFPDYQAKLEWECEQYEGNWYYDPQSKIKGWLCPAMFNYFDEAPTSLYIKFKSRE